MMVQFCTPVRLGSSTEEYVDSRGKVHAARWTIIANDETDRIEIHDKRTGLMTIVPYTNVAGLTPMPETVTKSPPVKQRGVTAS